MLLQDFLRTETHETRDRLDRLTEVKKDLRARRLAAEEHFKRTRGDLKLHRDAESHQSSITASIEEKLASLKSDLEMLERQRSEVLEALFGEEAKLQESRDVLTEERRKTQEAEVRSRDALGETEELDRKLKDLEVDEQRYAHELRRSTARAFECYVTALGERLRRAFAGDAARRKHEAAQLALRRARNQDADIGKLCDELDQIRTFLQQATVPAVQNLLDARRCELEEILGKQFPGALLVNTAQIATMPVEQLYYFIGDDGQARIVLPFNSGEWEALATDAAGPVESGCYRVAWTLVRALGIKAKDGEFALCSGRWELATSLDADDLEAFGPAISVEGMPGLSFGLCRVPPEVEEAITHEDPNR